MKRKIGSITCNWNCERYVMPHFSMLTSGGVDRSIVLQGTAPWGDYKEEYGLKEEPDGSEKLIREKFPQVEIHEACQNEYNSKLYNQGLEILKDCDIVLRLDMDMFMTKEDWKKFIKFLQETNYDCYRLDFSKRTINYYYDCDHGCLDAQEFDPIAVSPKGKFSGVLDYDYGTTYVISEEEDFIVHHTRGFKGYGANPDWIHNAIPTRFGVHSSELVAYHNPEGKWIRMPDELRNQVCPRKTEKNWKLNLGCGPLPIHEQHLKTMTPFEEWTLVDLYVKGEGINNWDATRLDEIENETVEHIYSSHLLEHLPHRDLDRILTTWRMKLIDGGKLTLNVPDLLWACDRLRTMENGQYVEGDFSDYDGERGIMEVFYGTQEHKGEFHNSGFTQAYMKRLLERNWYKNINVEKIFDAHNMGCLFVTAER